MGQNSSEQHEDVYNNLEKIVELVFANRTDQPKYVWVEPVAISIELETHTEYKLLTPERSFTIEYCSDSELILWMNHGFEFKLYKKVITQDKSNENWLLDIDYSDI